MSMTESRFQTASFPDDYAEILIETLAISSANYLSVKDSLYHFRHLGDDQAHEVMQRVVDLTDSDQKSRTPPRSLPSKLPPDPEGMNDERAAWAGRAVRVFTEATGTDAEDALCDLLADLMHWADRHRFDFDHELQRGRSHYEAETAGDLP
jgi:hypothetical protein